MSRISQAVLESFHDELRKFSFSAGGALQAAGDLAHRVAPGAQAAIGSAGALGGIGALGGGMIGSAVGGVKKYREAREEGASGRDAALSGLGGALSLHNVTRGMAVGGGLGAAAGGGLGVAAGAGLGALSPAKAEKIRESLTNAKGLVGMGARFGQRQAHGLTGWVPKGGLKEIRHGASQYEHLVPAAQKELDAARNGGGRSVADVLMGRTAVEGATGRLNKAHEAYNLAKRTEDMGLTSIPGYVKSLASRDPNKGVVNTVGTALKQQWVNGDPVNNAMMVGFPAVGVGAALLGKEEDPDHPGQGRFQRAAHEAVTGATGALLGPMAMGTQMVAQKGLGHAGDLVGRKIDKFRHSSALAPRAPDLTADSGQAVPGERVVSERAAAMGGEGSPS
jgi:hypothetical protein